MARAIQEPAPMPLPTTGPDNGTARARQDLQDLAEACKALWLATLSLMTAYMRTQAPAHRHLLARRIASNLRTLHAQPCYGPDTCERFERLAHRWEGLARQHHPDHPPAPREGLLALLRRLARDPG
jgi:hypothetical protein